MKDSLRLRPTIDFDGDRVEVLPHPNQHEQVGHDLEFADRKLPAQFPIRKAALKHDVFDRSDGHPGLNDCEVMFEPTARDTPDFNSSSGEVLLSSRTEPVDVLGSPFGREYGQVPGVEEPSESDRSGVLPHTGEGVADEVGCTGKAESRESVQHRLVALGELNGYALPTAVARLTTSLLSHGRNGFRTGKPQTPQGT